MQRRKGLRVAAVLAPGVHSGSSELAFGVPTPTMKTEGVMGPAIIQGGMGVGVSSWELARAVSSRGQMGVVSGTAVDAVLVRRLADGDPGGHLRRAMAAFPIQGIVEETLRRFYKPAGRAEGEVYPLLPLYQRTLDPYRERLLVLANFVEVHLAREGHEGQVGINYLTKIQIPTLPSLYGAMLAGVDAVLMGAGIPRDIPGALDALTRHASASLRFDVQGVSADDDVLTFDPASIWEGATPQPVGRPRFLAIVASDSLATMLVRKANGRIDGFVIEGPTAGGHNAPPRGKAALNERGEPVYGERDMANLGKIAELGLPFWLAGSTGSPAGLRAALAAGATGIQVGTLFAFAEESGLRPELRQQVLDLVRKGTIDVLTDGRASPTGFPFKIVSLEHSLSDDRSYAERQRICDLGYLRTAYRGEDERIGYRCASEPVDTFVRKGGTEAEMAGRKCLCNSLMANIGLAQSRATGEELPLLTSGDDLALLGPFLGDREWYTAADVIEYLLSGEPSTAGTR
jgi:NAD(P)H-dependent flavin oxidoreductase YrpB (nitropropane dioxygenase family)